jgi:hypothetical protein
VRCCNNQCECQILSVPRLNVGPGQVNTCHELSNILHKLLVFPFLFFFYSLQSLMYGVPRLNYHLGGEVVNFILICEKYARFFQSIYICIIGVGNNTKGHLRIFFSKGCVWMLHVFFCALPLFQNNEVYKNTKYIVVHTTCTKYSS